MRALGTVLIATLCIRGHVVLFLTTGSATASSAQGCGLRMRHEQALRVARRGYIA